MKKTSSKIKTSPQEKFLHVLNVFFLLIAVFLCVFPDFRSQNSHPDNPVSVWFLPVCISGNEKRYDWKKICIQVCSYYHVFKCRSGSLLHNHESIPFEQHFLAVYYSWNCKRILCHTDQNIYRTDSAVSSGVCGT